MSDRTFFATALLAAIVMVGVALLPGLNSLPSGPISGGGTDYRRIEVTGEQLNRLVAGGDADIELVKVDGRNVLRIAALHDALAGDPLMGPHLVLAPDLEVAFAGMPVKITVNARAADKYGASGLRLNYWAGTGEGSGWQDFTMTRQFEDVSFIYEPPPRETGKDPGYDYLAIRPEVPEDVRAVFISSIVFERTTASEAGDAGN
ncbi:hypothetical protein [Henriciella sp.]|uniref:hypothetical protein n=1 Tax=Henriciella sp. TaxID=1968823 RepID=UPI002620F487|nr:hypothetical protein [Henriciella sp.]